LRVHGEHRVGRGVDERLDGRPRAEAEEQRRTGDDQDGAEDDVDEQKFDIAFLLVGRSKLR
jgi:hypothetical protein